MSQLLKVGKIANTHGLKGEVKVIALTDDPKRFNDLEYVIIEGKTISVEGCKFQKDRVIVKLEGIDRIEDAERLKNKFMEIHREDAVELEEDCYFLADLRECTVFDTEGKELGIVFETATPFETPWAIKGFTSALVSLGFKIAFGFGFVIV